MEKGKFVQLLSTRQCEKFPGGDPVPAQALFRAVLVLLRLFAFPFKPGAKPVHLSDVHLRYVPFQYLESKLLSDYLWSFRGSCVRHAGSAALCFFGNTIW